ncbi:MAG TPA: RagB/SusD family nutrient uptake outer membrane protein, partial [Mucilaginibacter sp.]
MKSNFIQKIKHSILSVAPKGNITLMIMALIMIVPVSSCKKSFLDVVPDNVSTIANAFVSQTEAEKYLFTCYSYLPTETDPTYNVGLTAGDEVWVEDPANHIRSTNVLQLPRGFQTSSDPIANYMNGTRDAAANYKAIRDCNVFIENVSDLTKVRDLDIDTRERWIAEAQFLKAFYHFQMFRAYGPIPIIDKNLPIDASIDDIRVKRRPVDEVVNYIAGLYDQAAAKLPLTIRNEGSELGRVTKAAALSMKAKLLVTAASPLFNGNPDYSSFKNKDGEQLFNPAFSVEKWQRAADACKAAIDFCESQNIRLYTFPTPTNPLSQTTMTQMGIRNAMSEKWNEELIWGLTADNNINFNSFFQSMCAGQYDFNNADAAKSANRPLLGPTLKMAKMFYTKNGVPINEDKTLDFSDIAQLRVGTHDERFNIKEGEITARLNFDR